MRWVSTCRQCSFLVVNDSDFSHDYFQGGFQLGHPHPGYSTYDWIKEMNCLGQSWEERSWPQAFEVSGYLCEILFNTFSVSEDNQIANIYLLLPFVWMREIFSTDFRKIFVRKAVN